nr:MAG TPA: hypothetical protein [Caudoviricetes sp.]DAV03542.1 MAG TPA: hypothetical protein [Caudoviricetes sp.]
MLNLYVIVNTGFRIPPLVLLIHFPDAETSISVKVDSITAHG